MCQYYVYIVKQCLIILCEYVGGVVPFVIGRLEEVDPPFLATQNTPLPDYVKNTSRNHYRGVGVQNNLYFILDWGVGLWYNIHNKDKMEIL